MRITIYTRNDCVQCHATKRAMESRGFEFEMVNVDLVPDAADTLRAQGFRQLPVVVPVRPVGRVPAGYDQPSAS